jgi:hypothetical protein
MGLLRGKVTNGTGENGMKALVTLILCALLVAACTTQPRRGSVPDEQVTYDGLARSDRAGFDNVWLKPGTNFSSYTKIIVESPQLEFRTPGSHEDARYRQEHVRLTAADRQGITRMVNKTFREEFQKIRTFSVADQPGPDVLIVHTRLLDIFKIVPREFDDPAREMLGVVTEATLIAELHDSQTGEILARSVETSAKGYAGSLDTARQRDWSVLVQPVQRWSGEIRDRLDAIHDL